MKNNFFSKMLSTLDRFSLFQNNSNFSIPFSFSGVLDTSKCAR